MGALAERSGGSISLPRQYLLLLAAVPPMPCTNGLCMIGCFVLTCPQHARANFIQHNCFVQVSTHMRIVSTSKSMYISSYFLSNRTSARPRPRPRPLCPGDGRSRVREGAGLCRSPKRNGRASRPGGSPRGTRARSPPARRCVGGRSPAAAGAGGH